ncbi:cupin domain-containing protein [Streptomyces hoynatensis]|uniref:Cupin domain-containing protein n=1 Tax=Streptomyces hoynatensis TaxID=1141874 RepID=A0A3A9Z447_9ACTN|nr:cupin domain-containing protein [Streptomyces hoynatensis]RKN43191.1 cupin domain-containing protein [Streptomyces hoynatensis]
MRVNTPGEADVFTTATGAMTSLATPSRGTSEVSAWTVHMPAHSRGPLHSVDREQVWLPLSGTLTIEVDGEDRSVAPGQAAILPAGEPRQIRTGEEAAEVVVCMANHCLATVTATGEVRQVPWTE